LQISNSNEDSHAELANMNFLLWGKMCIKQRKMDLGTTATDTSAIEENENDGMVHVCIINI